MPVDLQICLTYARVILNLKNEVLNFLPKLVRNGEVHFISGALRSSVLSMNAHYILLKWLFGLSPFLFEINADHRITVNGKRYSTMINVFSIPQFEKLGLDISARRNNYTHYIRILRQCFKVVCRRILRVKCSHIKPFQTSCCEAL